MAADRRKADTNWGVADERGIPYEGVKGGALLAVLMDIRDRLDALRCTHFVAIPRTLRAIQRNTAKPKRKAARKRPRR